MIDLDDPTAPPPRRARVPRHVRWGLAGLAAGVAATLTVVTIVSARPPARPVAAVALGPTVDRAALAAQAQRDFARGIFGPNVVAAAPARVLERPSPTAQSIRDIYPPVARGDYTLVVYCFGSGRVSIRLAVGDHSEEHLAACGDADGPTQVSLAGAAGPIEVRVLTVDTETVAVSYGVFRDSPAS